MTGKTLRAAPVLAVLSLITACSTSTVTVHSASSSSAAAESSAASSAPAAPASPGYPQQAADEALCSTYNSDSTPGDLQAIAQAVAQAGSSVTPVLAHDMLTVVNNPGTVAQDEHNMVYVALDCGMVSAGEPPVEMNKSGGG
jgi:hypothetical protein